MNISNLLSDREKVLEMIEAVNKALEPFRKAMKALWEAMKISFQKYAQAYVRQEKSTPYYQHFAGQRRKGGRSNPRLGIFTKVHGSLR